jgi:hypothetical protein
MRVGPTPDPTRAPRPVSASRRGILRKISKLAFLSRPAGLPTFGSTFGQADQNGAAGKHGTGPEPLCGLGQQAPVIRGHFDTDGNCSFLHGERWSDVILFLARKLKLRKILGSRLRSNGPIQTGLPGVASQLTPPITRQRDPRYCSIVIRSIRSTFRIARSTDCELKGNDLCAGSTPVCFASSFHWVCQDVAVAARQVVPVPPLRLQP